MSLKRPSPPSGTVIMTDETLWCLTIKDQNVGKKTTTTKWMILISLCENKYPFFCSLIVQKTGVLFHLFSPGDSAASVPVICHDYEAEVALLPSTS